MKSLLKTGVAAVAIFAASAVHADEEANLVINEEIEITVRTDAPAHTENLSTIYSGWVFRSDETQALQMDDFENPGMIFVDDAIEAWNAVEGTEGNSCASCHGDPESMAGVRAVYPKWNDAAEEVRTMAM